MAVVSPLHRVIDAGRWDAERLLGRLIIVIHAAFLDAGFVPVHQRSRKPGPVPRQAGRTASALSLRYGTPQLLHRREEEVAVLRMLAHGRHLVLYVQCDPWPVERCVPVDALAAAPLLSGGLDSTARALRTDARLAGLWRRLIGDLCRRALVDMCRRNGVALEPTFMSLPGDAKAAILARLTDGADLASVECVCTGLRRLVAGRDRELWKPRYDEALRRRRVSCVFPDGGHLPPETSWKERYVRARRCHSPEIEVIHTYTYICTYRLYDYISQPFVSRFPPRRRPADLDDEPELAADPVADRRNRIAGERGKRAAGRGRMPPCCGQENRRRGAGAIHAPFSRYRWKHR